MLPPAGPVTKCGIVHFAKTHKNDLKADDLRRQLIETCRGPQPAHGGALEEKENRTPVSLRARKS